MHKPTLKLQTSMPILKTVEQMSQTSGLGVNTLRKLMADGDLEYVLVGNRRLLSDRAIFDWYERNKVVVLQEVN